MLKIALGDLRHRTIGRHSTLMPLGIGLIASYCKSQLSGSDIRMYDNPDEILDEIDEWQPDVIGLSNYMWNAEINNLVFQYAKKVKNNTLCIAGGPEFPTDTNECLHYLKARPAIDFYAQLEGEIVFADLVRKCLEGCDLDELKRTPFPGLFSIHPTGKTLVTGGPLFRIDNLDIIPSPYLTGIMDKWFDSNYSPTIQTTRGCPYECSYCRAGNSQYSKVYQFNINRVLNEIEYIAKRIHKCKSIELLIMDSNFGLFERDERIAEHISFLQQKYDWPHAIIADTSRNHTERVSRMASKMRNCMRPLNSLQSTNEETLKIINRKNVSLLEYTTLLNKHLAKGLKPATELIIPLPQETKRTFISGIGEAYKAGVEMITVFTWMMLPGTKLASVESRAQYGIQSGYRVIPRQFGTYRGVKCFENEEVCYATSTMQFDEYIECRGFSFLYYIFAGTQYDIVKKHLADLDLDIINFIERIILQLLRPEKSAFSTFFNHLLNETKNEIIHTREELYQRYSREDNYQLLLQGKIGDNLFRKYLAAILLDGFQSSVDVIYSSIDDLIKDRSDYTICREFLNSAKQWMVKSRDISDIYKNPHTIDRIIEIDLPFDINAWYVEESNTFPFDKFRTNTRNRFSYSKKKEFVRDILCQNQKLYGEVYYSLGKMLVNYSPDVLWKEHEYVHKQIHAPSS